MTEQSPLERAVAFLKNATLEEFPDYVRITKLLETRQLDTPIIHEYLSTISLTIQTKPIKFVFHDRNGNRGFHWYFQGAEHNPYSGPSTIMYRQDEFRERWLQHGLYHREDGPSLIETSNYLHSETWYVVRDGKLMHHRVDGPARINRFYSNTKTGKWSDYRHHNGSTANVFSETDSLTFADLEELHYYENGRIRNGIGSIESQNFAEKIEMVGSDIVRIRYSQTTVFGFNINHRLSRIDGPAVIKLHGYTQTFRNGTCVNSHYSSYSPFWHLNGNHIPMLELTEWARQAGITLRDGPCLDQPAFLTDLDQAKFLLRFG